MADLEIASTSPHSTTGTSSPPSTNYCSYDVFINHRGPDVKHTFAINLYHRLLSHGLQPFLDKEELQKGEYIAPQIEGAIRTASVHIAVFSPTYAESKWCLDELVLICKSGAITIPVFYNVKPSELRWAGRYAQSLSIHEQKGRYDRQTLQSWREALKDVSYRVGFELEAYDSDEGKLLDNVVRCVLKERRKAALNVATYPTGLQEKVQDFEKTVSLHQKGEKVQVLGIVGLGGVGKTTLAKELFNRQSSHFGKSYFLFDVRETAVTRSLNSLQSKLIKGLTKWDVQIDSVNEGIEILGRYLSSCHALVVLDDVDQMHQRDALLPIKDVLHSDSLILVTSRYKDVLTSSGIAESSIYKLTGLNERHSQQLFCSYAFLQPHPSLGFEYLVNEFCMACDGLPLSLKVFGALLCGKNDNSYWEGQLGKLSQITLPNEIEKSLKISYDALDGQEKQIFLDIACYFIGEDRDMAIRIWDGSDWNGLVGLLNLESKCLVDIKNNKIKMHDHLRDMGRNIADHENSSGRFWRTLDDIHDLWQQQSSVISEVRGIRTVPGRIHYSEFPELEGIPWFISWCDEVFGNCVRNLIDTQPHRFRKLQLVATEDGNLESILRRVESPNLIWIRWINCPYSSLPSSIPLKNTRVLEVAGNKLKILWLAESQAPLALRELNIYAPLSKFPKSIGQLKHIEKIVLNYASDLIHLKSLPEEFCYLRSLKYLHLCCPYMKSLPDSFGHLSSLQHLDLSECWSLDGLPNSFQNLIRLKHLNLQNGYNLTMSEEAFANISTLEYLVLSQCKSLEVLPAQVVHQPSLKVIRLFDTRLKELPVDIGKLSSLELLVIGSPLLEMLPHSLAHLSSLKELWFSGCLKLKSLPDSLGLLTQLSTLWIAGCGIESLPPEIVKMKNLVVLKVTNCPLRELPLKKLVEGERKTLTDPTGQREYNLENDQQFMYRLEHLELGWTEITQISFHQDVCPNLKHLVIAKCDNLVEVGTLPPTLIRLQLYSCSALRKIEGLCNLTKLRKLDIRRCIEVEEFPTLERLKSLEEFLADECSKLKRIQDLGQLAELRILSLLFCNELEDLAGVEDLKSLESLNVADCPKLQWGGGVVEQLGQRLKSLIL